MPKINAAIQLLPLKGSADAIELIDKAIDIISQSGLVHQVCPFETVVEGEAQEVYLLIDQIKASALQNGCEELIINIKLHAASKDVLITEKMEKY
jgi:uncharacterized protein YqgV (UPF0045/DUF77 family)